MKRTGSVFFASALLLGSVCGVGAETRVTRVFLPERLMRGNTGIAPVQAIDSAAWIWHPTANDDFARKEMMEATFRGWGIHPFPLFPPAWTGDVFVRFRNTFFADGDGPIRIHVSGDERYVLLLDGQIIARGPDRGTVERWCYSTYELALDPGRHTLEAMVCWLGPDAPLAQLSWRGGFILKAEGAYDERLTTGKGLWRVALLPGARSTGIGANAWGTGMQMGMAGAAPLGQEVPESAYLGPVVVREPLTKLRCGCDAPGWRLYPSTLPDQMERACTPGRFRAAVDTVADEVVFQSKDSEHPVLTAANALLMRGVPLTLPAHTEVGLLWDLENYYCAYPQLTVSGGRGAVIRWGWTESPIFSPSEKGNRNEFVGKKAECVTDALLADGGTDRLFTTPWWRCGKWCLLRVKTGEQPVTLSGLRILETRYPMERESFFACDDSTLDAVQKICVRGMQMCAHEMFFDCPFYEQQMYPGDTRVQLLTVGAMTSDDRLIRRAIELYDFSRREDGMVGMNFPTRHAQDSATYTLIWPLMFRDYVMWHDHPEWLRARMPGLRATMHGLELYENADGLLENLPGWCFIDWVPGVWNGGVPPDGYGLNALNNLFYVLALQSTAVTEDALGNGDLAAYWRKKAERVARETVRRFWCEKRGLMADSVSMDSFSEHAQCLALLTDILSDDQAKRALDGLIHAPDLTRTSVYFTHYLFDTYTRFGRTDLMLKRLDIWRQYVKDGMCTPLESPGHARSDCHAWGSHPIYHLQTGCAGVTPAEPFFKSVRIAPQPGGLKTIRSRIPHPKGGVEVDLTFEDGHVRGSVRLPDGVPGTFVWGAGRVALHGGAQEIDL